MEDLKKLIREVPDFPKPGILFYDITTLLKDGGGFRAVIDGLKQHYRAGSFSRRRWPMPWARASCRYASPTNCPPHACE
jgi:hypothetical protein